MRPRFRYGRREEAGRSGVFTAFLDVITNTTLVFTVLLIAWLVISTIKKEDQARGAVRSIITVHIIWPKGNEDIDTWGLGPDGEPVGYSKLQSAMLVLLRDDTGHDPATPANEEFMVSVADKENIAGHYVFNVFCYRCDRELIVEAKVMIQKIKNNVVVDMQTVFEKKVVMEKEGEEKTILQFDMNEKGEFVKESVNEDFKRIARIQPGI